MMKHLSIFEAVIAIQKMGEKLNSEKLSYKKEKEPDIFPNRKERRAAKSRKRKW